MMPNHFISLSSCYSGMLVLFVHKDPYVRTCMCTSIGTVPCRAWCESWSFLLTLFICIFMIEFFVMFNTKKMKRYFPLLELPALYYFFGFLPVGQKKIDLLFCSRFSFFWPFFCLQARRSAVLASAMQLS
jgi:hypothetical protein